MTSAADAAGTARVAFGIAYVCRHQDELRTWLTESGTDPSALTELLAALQGQDTPQPSGKGQADPSIPGLLDRLDAVMLATGDAIGVYGVGLRSSGPSGMEPLQVVFRCPLRLCAGRPADRHTGPEPVCTVSTAKRPLIRERLT